MLFSTADSKGLLVDDIVLLGLAPAEEDTDARAAVVDPTSVSVVVATLDFLLSVRVTVVVATVVVDVSVVVDGSAKA